MNRKSLIICLAALGAMLLVMVIAIAVLYHDGDKNKDSKVETRYELFQAVPSDAVALACLSHVKDVSQPAFSGFA